MLRVLCASVEGENRGQRQRERKRRSDIFVSGASSPTMKTMGDMVADPADEQSVGTSASSTQNPTVGKEFGQKTLRSLKRGLGRLWRRHRGNASITEYDPCYKVAYLGNVLTGWAKGK